MGKGQASHAGRSQVPLTASIVTYLSDNRLSLRAMPEFGGLIRARGPNGAWGGTNSA